MTGTPLARVAAAHGVTIHATDVAPLLRDRVYAMALAIDSDVFAEPPALRMTRFLASAEHLALIDPPLFTALRVPAGVLAVCLASSMVALLVARILRLDAVAEKLLVRATPREELVRQLERLATFAAGWFRWTRGGLFGWDVPRLSSMVGKPPSANVVENELNTSIGQW